MDTVIFHLRQEENVTCRCNPSRQEKKKQANSLPASEKYEKNLNKRRASRRELRTDFCSELPTWAEKTWTRWVERGFHPTLMVKEEIPLRLLLYQLGDNHDQSKTKTCPHGLVRQSRNLIQLSPSVFTAMPISARVRSIIFHMHSEIWRGTTKVNEKSDCDIVRKRGTCRNKLIVDSRTSKA